MILIKAIFLSVFSPKGTPKDIIEKQIVKYGSLFILIRWAYYSIVLSIFRDYNNDWSPFIKPPFGLSIDTYAFWQSKLAIFFGFFLMAMIAGGLFVLFRRRNKLSLSFIKIMNLLGFTYFIPFVILQPVDKLIINIFGWTPFIIIPLHTIVLIWEAKVTVILIDKIYPIKLFEKYIGVFLQITIWIMLCTIFWR
jgi:hypothetical protein